MRSLIAVLSALVASTVAIHPLGGSDGGGRPSAQAVQLPSSAAAPEFGVLIADAAHQSTDWNAGVRLAMVNLDWSRWEPQPGVFSASYVGQEQSIVAGYRAQGWTVGLNLGLNYTPGWVLALPDGQLVDQSGARSGTPDFEFSQAVRSAGAAYFANVVSALGSTTYVTVGISASSEALYPVSNGWDTWWGFENSAVTGTDLPPGVGTNPMPAWMPGATSWNGTPVTSAQVGGWYSWYLGALVNALGWEMSTLRADGFNGWFQLQLPGDGTNPWVYQHRLAADLASESYDSYQTMNAGAVYQRLIPDLAATQPDLVVDVTSVGDGSGTPGDNACTAADAGVDWTSDPAVTSWSSVRWLSYLAGRSGLPVIGESTGWDSAAGMGTDFQLVKSCGLIGLQWAFDDQLYAGGYATAGQYATDIAAATAPTADPGTSVGGPVAVPAHSTTVPPGSSVVPSTTSTTRAAVTTTSPGTAAVTTTTVRRAGSSRHRAVSLRRTGTTARSRHGAAGVGTPTTTERHRLAGRLLARWCSAPPRRTVRCGW